MTPMILPILRTLESRHQGDRREFWLLIAADLPPARAKRILMEAHGYGFLSSADCETFINACGLGSA